MTDVLTAGADEEQREWEGELRGKYTQKQRDEMAKTGEAMPDGSYPIKDAEDLDNAISTVGLGNAPDSAIRKHIIARAKTLGLSSKIPDAWNADGSKKQTNGLKRRKERRRAVPLMPEVRHWRTTGLEIRSSSDTDEIVITGSPIVFDTPYPVRDMFGEFQETMAPGVAREALQNGADVRFLFNHDGLPLARSTSGTMTLSEVEGSVDFEARLDARQQLANDLAIAIERGDVSQMSCGFIVARDEWDEQMENRTIHQFADLLDVSAVTYPASPTTSLQIAHRMTMEMPIESRARLRSLIVETKSGAVLSSPNKQHAATAIESLLTLYKAGGGDLSDFIDPDDDGDNDLTVEGDTDQDFAGQATNQDASIGETPESQGFLDATGERQVDPGEKMRTLRAQTAARKRRK